MLADVITYLPNDILVKIDRAAMSASLETRAPFLTTEYLHWPGKSLDLKLREGVGKWCLRQLLYRYVPRSLVDRPKAGFATPIGPWLRGPCVLGLDLLDPNLIRRQGWLQADNVQRLWQSHLSGSDNSSQLWNILMWQSGVRIGHPDFI